MKITFLGSGGAYGVPIWNCGCKACVSDNPKNKRMRPSVLIEIGGKNIVIDFGQDFGRQLLEFGVKKLDYALLTHSHGDHRADMGQLQYQDDLQVVVPKEVIADMERKGSAFKGITNRNSTIEVKNFEPFEVGGFMIDTVELEHKKKFAEQNLAVFGYVFRSDDFSFAYLTDYNRIIEEDKLGDLDLIVSDSTSWEDEGIGHVGVKGAVEVFKKLKPKRMLLTHINHRVEHDEVTEYLKEFGDIAPAFDGMVVEG